MDKQRLEELHDALIEFQAQAPYELGSTEDRTLTDAIELVEEALYPDLD
tara:strand:- start:22 stop:168 length:147 start_codon:yes stop_codon:yes gene_type:complete